MASPEISSPCYPTDKKRALRNRGHALSFPARCWHNTASAEDTSCPEAPYPSAAR